MIDGMPVLCRIDTSERVPHQLIDLRHNFQTSRNGQLTRTKIRKPLLHINHE